MVEVRMTMEEYLDLISRIQEMPMNSGVAMGIVTDSMRSGLLRVTGEHEMPPKPKTKRRKRRPALSKGWKEANQRLRNKNGSLKKGKTQSDVARLAHKLAKKYKK